MPQGVGYGKRAITAGGAGVMGTKKGWGAARPGSMGSNRPLLEQPRPIKVSKKLIGY